MPLAKADGANIYYEVIGQGDPLVLIQGYGHHLLHWGALPQEFVKIGYQVVLVDNRGVGRSDKPDAPLTIATMADDVCKVMDAAGIGRASVFGISMGGIIAQVFAFNHADRLNAMVLGCTTPSGEHHIKPDPEGTRILFDYEYLKDMAPEQRSQAVFSFFCSEEYLQENPDSLKYYHMVTMQYPTPNSTFVRQAEAMLKEDTWDRLPDIKAPTMIIAGTADRIVPFKNSQLLEQRIPGAELVLLQDKQHGFFIEAMDSTRIFVNGFLKRKLKK